MPPKPSGQDVTPKTEKFNTALKETKVTTPLVDPKGSLPIIQSPVKTRTTSPAPKSPAKGNLASSI